ncbi:MAG: DUF4129 domain-containing protein [Halobacteriota archaeon]
MDSSTIRSAVVGLIGVIAVALAASTLSSTVQPGGSGSGPPRPGAGSDGLLPGARPGAFLPRLNFDIPFLEELLLLLAILLVLVSLWYVSVERRGLLQQLVGLLLLAGLLFLLILLIAPEFSPRGFELLDPTNGTLVPGGGGGTTETTTPALPSSLLVLLIGLVVLGAMVALFRRSAAAPVESEREDDPQVDTEAVGRAAGRAADRIESATDVDNEIYRAWREMTALLEVSSPETYTPGAFESTAIDAGMDAADVRELTRLFEDVRYGGREPSSTDEQRAIAVFRRIEDVYAEDES